MCSSLEEPKRPEGFSFLLHCLPLVPKKEGPQNRQVTPELADRRPGLEMKVLFPALLLCTLHRRLPDS